MGAIRIELSVLNFLPKAQLKRRTGGGGPGGEEAEEDKGTGERESQKEEAAPSPSQLPRSPRPASQLAGAARVLPPLGGTDGGWETTCKTEYTNPRDDEN